VICVKAPFAEELVFRSCICSLLIAGGELCALLLWCHPNHSLTNACFWGWALIGWGLTWTVLGSPFLFGIGMCVPSLFASTQLFVACPIIYIVLGCWVVVGGGWWWWWWWWSAAHMHHLIGLVRQRHLSVAEGLGLVLFQLFYTTVFGAFAGFVYLRTGHTVAPVLCHAFCNFMGFPNLRVFRHPDPTKKWGTL
jgi:membrane protease YdiL (CAAX protease family)